MLQNNDITKKVAIKRFISIQFFRATLLPLFVIVLSLVTLYFVINAYNNQQTKNAMQTISKSHLQEITAEHANKISEQIHAITALASVMQKETERFFKAPDLFPKPETPANYGFASNGVYYKLSNNGGASLFYPTVFPVGDNRMTTMIEGLLVYSRLNKDSESFTSVDLNEISGQLKELELNILLEETNTILEVSENMPKVLGDETQVKQLLQNFISNGIKYRAKDVQPRITVTAEQIEGEKVKVKVSDNGIGIEDKYYDEVFKMFRRLHSRQEYEGTGIGLAVCKKIIDKHHGQIGVESEAGKGSTFWFILSMAEEAEQREHQEAVSDAAC